MVHLSSTLDTSEMSLVRWWIDALFEVHLGYRSHTGAVQPLGRGWVTNISKKQRFNTKSSTEAKVVGVDDASLQILWKNYFIRGKDIMLIIQ